MEHQLTKEQLVDEQVKRWEANLRKRKEEGKLTIVTVSRQPGSGGHWLAAELAKELGFDFFSKRITQAIAENTNMRTQWLASLEDNRVSVLEDMIAAVVEKHHLWNYEYIQNLVKVILTIGEHGNAVILGRGANLILPREKNFRVRVIAPLAMRIQNLSEWLKISSEQAKEYLQKTTADRRDFIKKYFNADINDPEHFDLVLNMEKIKIKSAIEMIKLGMKSKYLVGTKEFWE